MPIISSLLDIDFYKLTMAQFAWLYHPTVEVKYALNNRTKSVGLADFVSPEEVRGELEHVLTLRFGKNELDFLRGSKYIPVGIFCEDFLKFLDGMRLPVPTVRAKGSELQIEVKGPWPSAIFWETIILGVVSKLYGYAVLRQKGMNLLGPYAEGLRRLDEKIAILRASPIVHFVDFGTRRRFNREWHGIVVERLLRHVPEQLLGTSNVLLAKDLGIPPRGTYAHELDMVYAAIYHLDDEEIRRSHQFVLEGWYRLYGAPLSVALTDTFGSEFFFNDFTAEQARKWRGYRQDSGDPFAVGERAIAFLENLGIDPTQKSVFFSDALDVHKMVALANRFAGRIEHPFGVGTNFTNDLGFVDPLSLVVKAVEADGHSTVKLSDNLAKATGSAKDIARFKKIFGYTKETYEEVRY